MTQTQTTAGPLDFSLTGKRAVVTGASRGLGWDISIALADYGADVIGFARTASELEALEAEIVGRGRRFLAVAGSVGDTSAVNALAERAEAEFGGVDILVNNAGVALGGTFEQVSESDFEWLFEINFWGVVRMTRAFLPLLRASEDARLVNVSSLYGLVSPAGQTAYSASKFAVRGFSNALRQELQGTRIAVTVVHPGGVATAIARNARLTADTTPEQAARGRARADQLLRLPPEQAGEIIVTAAERRAPRVLVGRDAKIVALMERLAPVGHVRIFGRPMA